MILSGMLKINAVVVIGTKYYKVTKVDPTLELTPLCQKCNGTRKLDNGEQCDKCGGAGTI